MPVQQGDFFVCNCQDIFNVIFLDLSGLDITMPNLPKRYSEMVTMSSEVEQIIYGDDGERYISEVAAFHQ